MLLVLVLSGAVGSGKSTLAQAVSSSVSAERLSTRQIIISLKEVPSTREALQAAGDQLDQETGFAWVGDAVARAAGTDRDVLIVDAVRRVEQLTDLRERFGARVRHIHLTASEDELRRRHSQRDHDVTEPIDFEEVRLSATEQQVHSLAEAADAIVDVTRLDQATIAAAALAGTPLALRRTSERLVDVLIGGQYGSEGKGNITSFIAPEYQVLVRVGGPNAGHIVQDPYFKFAQLPSGSIHNLKARLIIGPAATISLDVLFGEFARLTEMGFMLSPERLSIDPQAIIIEKSDIEWESGALGSIGSTKQGVGAATGRKILNRGSEKFGHDVRLARDIHELREFIRPTFVELQRAYGAGERVLLEGTQGTDISLHHGMWPHVTSRETSASGCLADAGIGPTRVREVIMVTRTYPIRVGGPSGYLGEVIDAETVAERSGLRADDVRRTETGTISGNPRRIAEFDLGQVARSAALNGATMIAMTFADYLGAENRKAPVFEDLSPEAQERVRELEDATGVPVGLIAVGPTPSNIIDRRRV